MAVRVFLDADTDPKALQERLNAFLDGLDERDIAAMPNLSSHSNNTQGVVHVARVIFQIDVDENP